MSDENGTGKDGCHLTESTAKVRDPVVANSGTAEAAPGMHGPFREAPFTA
jgi:hypothetical protein